MSWIETISYQASKGKLRKLFERVKGPDGYIDNILLVHGLRPHTLEGHMVLYKNVLHHQDNALDKWFLESIGVLVSLLNQCDYCVEHHFAGLKKLLNDDARAGDIRLALEQQSFKDAFSPKESLALHYAMQVTQHPGATTQHLVEGLRNAGFSDGEILEINQVTSYFAYANRTVLGLGVTLQDDILGMSPNDSSDAKNWSHS